MGKFRFPLRPTYNSPVILTFALAACVIMAADGLSGGRLTPNLFATYPGFQWTSPLFYVRLISHVLGHKNWAHVTANFSVILLIGPILEEKYGSARLIKMMLITALVTGVLNAAFFTTGLLGASGLAFMMILLASFTNHKEGEIPLTFVLVVVLFLAKEAVQAFSQDDISQFAHIIGGICGSLFGFLRGSRKGGR
ncbi:MAG: Rhomboid family protein [Fibrobacteres bacterium]|jgi:membrane associated rhomboid family serine protease|nr:Rhomboid family protein [Fibrobacterota bacterium]